MSHLTHPFEIRRVGNASVLICRNMATVRIGVLVPKHYETVDLTSVNILLMMGKSGLREQGLPETLIDLAPNISIVYITTWPVEAKNDVLGSLRSINDADVQPGKLDTLLVLESNEEGPWDEGLLNFLRGHAREESTDILVISTGVYSCAEAGILQGRTVAGGWGLQDSLARRYHDIDFVGDRYRWFQDKRLWSGGDKANANDMVAAYALRSPHFPNPVVEIATTSAEVGHRSQKY